MSRKPDTDRDFNSGLVKYLDRALELQSDRRQQDTMTEYNNHRRSRKGAIKRKFLRGQDDFGVTAKESYEGNQHERVTTKQVSAPARPV